MMHTLVPDQATALDIIHRVLRQKGWALATAESLTAGMIASTVAARSGCSKYLRGGFVVYDLNMKVQVLGVDREMAASCNCVSEAVAMQMALGAQKRTEAQCVIAVTGYAEPWPEGGVPDAGAYYTILCGGAASQGYFNGAGMRRNVMRQALTQHVLCELAAMLEAL